MAITFSRLTHASGWGNTYGMSASINAVDIVTSGATFNLPVFTGTITNWVNNSAMYPQSTAQGYNKFTIALLIDGNIVTYSRQYYEYDNTLILPESSGWSSKSWTASGRQDSRLTALNTSDYFNSSNSTTRTLPITLRRDYWGIDGATYTTSDIGTGSVNLTLDVPPTATVSAISYDTGYIYAGLTTASVTISDVAAYYGGTISSVVFTIGNQTATGSGNGTLSIALANPGTFTPTVTVTDSRGQTKTYTLPAITVNTYTAPTISFDVERTDSTGTPDDEGTYGFIEAILTFSDAVASAVAPSVVLTDENGTQTTPVVSWYTDNALTTPVVWSNVSSGDTVYGIFSGLNTNYSYTVSVRPRDSEGTGTAITQTISSAFYTIDFLAGGHGIAFGKPASNVGFECAMPTTFDDVVNIDGVLTCGDDVLIDLPEYQTAATTDKAIYDAIVALGWDSEVLQ